MSTYLFLAAIATLIWIVGMAVMDARHAHHRRAVERHQVAAQLRRVNSTPLRRPGESR